MTRQELNAAQRFTASQTVNQTFNEATRRYRSEMGALKDRIRKIQTMIDDPSQKDAVAGLIKDLMHQSECLLYTAVEPDPVDTDRIMDDAFATISSDFDPTFSPMTDAGIHALALLNDAVYSSSVITAEEAAAFLSQCTEHRNATYADGYFTVVIEEDALHSFHRAMDHDRSPRHANSKRYVKMIFDCAASLSMFGNKDAFIGDLVLLPTPVIVKMGSGIIKATLGGIARINIPRSERDEDGYWSFYVFGIYVTFTDPDLILLSSHYLSYLGLGDTGNPHTTWWNEPARRVWTDARPFRP